MQGLSEYLFSFLYLGIFFFKKKNPWYLFQADNDIGTMEESGAMCRLENISSCHCIKFINQIYQTTLSVGYSDFPSHCLFFYFMGHRSPGIALMRGSFRYLG